jgi:hypothetical protein
LWGSIIGNINLDLKRHVQMGVFQYHFVYSELVELDVISINELNLLTMEYLSGPVNILQQMLNEIGETVIDYSIPEFNYSMELAEDRIMEQRKIVINVNDPFVQKTFNLFKSMSAQKTPFPITKDESIVTVPFNLMTPKQRHSGLLFVMDHLIEDDSTKSEMIKEICSVCESVWYPVNTI